MDMVNCMLLSSGAPANLWGEALLSAYFILNRVPQRDSDITPYERWKRRTPNIQFFKVWGCLAKVSISKLKKRIVGIKTVDAIFIGYALDNNVNRFLVVNSEISEISNNIIIEDRDAVFLRTSFLSNIESLVIPLLLLLPLIFLLIVLFLPLILNLEGAELGLLHLSVNTSHLSCRRWS